MLSRKAEDYLEAILNISEKKGYAMIRDIALALNVKPSSVVEMVKRLNDRGFVNYRKYDGDPNTRRGRDRKSSMGAACYDKSVLGNNKSAGANSE